MKRRRVQEHADLVSLLSTRSHAVYACLVDYAGTSDQFKACVPNAVRTHGRFGKLRKALRKAYEKLQDWDMVLDLCFNVELDDDTYHNEYVDMGVDGIGGGLPNHLHSVQHTEQKKYSSGDSDDEVSSDIKPDFRVIFDAERCWSYYKEGYETVGDLNAALVQEIEEFKKCAKFEEIMVPGKPTLSPSYFFLLCWFGTY
ncbi:hypothetical protein EON65_51845 [archaeon]|nr:MAG: hypothetical protein EON65_51845 [archaeon]